MKDGIYTWNQMTVTNYIYMHIQYDYNWIVQSFHPFAHVYEFYHEDSNQLCSVLNLFRGLRFTLCQKYQYKI